MPTTRSNGAANKQPASKQNVSDILSDREGDVPTKKAKQSTVASHRQQQRLSASPITPPNGPRKQTNERPGLIGKKVQCTKAEIAQEKAKKAEEAKAIAAAKVDAMAQLVEMEVDQEDKEATRRQQILRRQPSVLDVLADHSGEEFDWKAEEEREDTESPSENERTLTRAGNRLSPGSEQVKVMTSAASQGTETDSYQ